MLHKPEWQFPTALEVSVRRRKGVEEMGWGELSLEDVKGRHKTSQESTGPVSQSKNSASSAH